MKYNNNFGLIANWELKHSGIDKSGYNGHLYMRYGGTEGSIPKYSFFRKENNRVGFYDENYVLYREYDPVIYINPDRPFSISFFFKVYSSGLKYFITNVDTASFTSGFVVSLQSNQIRFENRTGTIGIDVSTTNSIIKTNVLYHVCITYDGKNSAKGISFYIDGILQNKTINSSSSAIVSSTENILLGGSIQLSNYVATPVFLSDVRIYNREIFPQEILEIIFPFQNNSYLFLSPFLNDNAPLYIFGTSGVTDNIPLYLENIADTNNYLNLFTLAPLYYSNDYFPLFEHGSSAGFSGVYNQIPLYIEGTGGLNSNVNLFLSSYGPEPYNSNISLYTISSYETSIAYIPLHLSNSGVYNNIPFYTKGLGTYDGYIPHATGMNLFVQQMFGNYIPFYLIAPGTEVSGNLNTYCFGVNIFNSGLDLSMPVADQSINNNIKGYIHGF